MCIDMDGDPITDTALWNDSVVCDYTRGFGWGVVDERHRSTGCPSNNADAVDGVIAANRERYPLRCGRKGIREKGIIRLDLHG